MEIKASRIPWLGTFAWLLHLRDVTERNRLQESLLQSQRMELLGTISAGLVHDLNNVLGAISGNAQVMQWVEKDRMDTFVENIVAGCGRGAGMLQQLLEFARGSAGEQEAVNLVEIAREVIKLTDHSFGSRYHLDLQGEASPPPVMGNTTQLHQIMMNLCVNARDAMPEGGQITMRFDVRPPPRNDDFNVGGPDKSWRDTEFVVLDVADSGTGIPEDVLPKLFDPLFTTKPIGQGTGLGLATVSKLMKDHGGFVLAGNQSAGGAVFSCYFPMAGVIA
jgi:signal transduction histidine kinase